ncbi:LrgA family protein [Clostridiales bacterium oral taxon 876 str. F0540]|nr:LrgA family protein [Clostridiales bacterium oral taxon 876 str. F0540]
MDKKYKIIMFKEGKNMKFLRQFAIILVICFAGEALHRFLRLPIPGSVIGMILLLLGLTSGIIKLKHIEETSDFLLNHLAFFFVPAGVGIISSLDVMKGNWIPIFTIILISTIVVMVTTGITVQLLKGGK